MLILLAINCFFKYFREVPSILKKTEKQKHVPRKNFRSPRTSYQIYVSGIVL